MSEVRDRLAVAIAGGSIAYAAVMAYVIRLDIGTPSDSWLLATLVGIHVVPIFAWLVRPTIKRRFIVAFGAIETAAGLAIFWTAPIARGRFAPPGEPLLGAVQAWGLVGLAVAGVGVIVAGVLHSSPRSEQKPDAG